MNKTYFVIAVAVGTALLTTLVLTFMQHREADGHSRVVLWLLLLAGAALLAAVALLALLR